MKQLSTPAYDLCRYELAGAISRILSLNSLETLTVYHSLEKPPESHLGDYAYPCFQLAKALRKNPVEIAKNLSLQLVSSQEGLIDRVEPVGAFCNIFTKKEKVFAKIIPKALDQSLFTEIKTHFKPEHPKIMIEFSQPNTHKEFHVGHGRNVCLGDSIVRMHRFAGYQVTAVNYIGDEGTHVAKCLWQLVRSKEEEPQERYSRWLGEKYRQASQLLSDDSNKDIFKEEVSRVLNDLEKKEGLYYELWMKTREKCLKDFDSIYSWLDVHFDHVFYESDVSEESQSIVDEYLEKGLFQKSDGAIGIDMSQWKLGFFLARKTDGTTLYITKDLALARRKFKDFDIDQSVYVVGSEQNYHFRQLFKALELMGFKQSPFCHHLSYAHVTLPHGKMSSRKGDVITFAYLQELIESEIANHLAKYKDLWTKEEIAQTSHKLTIAALKYGMLATDPAKEIVFDAASWTSFEGNSGTYLCYSYARSLSILKKCADAGYKEHLGNYELLNHETEHELLRFLHDFNLIVKMSVEQYKPSLLCTHLYNMCRAFNRFYANVSVLNAKDDREKQIRMSLILAFARVLEKGLELLGIAPPEKM